MEQQLNQIPQKELINPVNWGSVSDSDNISLRVNFIQRYYKERYNMETEIKKPTNDFEACLFETVWEHAVKYYKKWVKQRIKVSAEV